MKHAETGWRSASTEKKQLAEKIGDGRGEISHKADDNSSHLATTP